MTDDFETLKARLAPILEDSPFSLVALGDPWADNGVKFWFHGQEEHYYCLYFEVDMLILSSIDILLLLQKQKEFTIARGFTSKNLKEFLLILDENNVDILKLIDFLKRFAIIRMKELKEYLIKIRGDGDLVYADSIDELLNSIDELLNRNFDYDGIYGTVDISTC